MVQKLYQLLDDLIIAHCVQKSRINCTKCTFSRQKKKRYKMTLYERIKRVATIRGLSLREVAKKAGFKSETAIYRYNQGVSPRDTTLASIADALDTTVEFLKGETEDYSTVQNKNSKDGLSVDEAIDHLQPYQGKPISDDQKKILKDLVKGYLDRNNK